VRCFVLTQQLTCVEPLLPYPAALCNAILQYTEHAQTILGSHSGADGEFSLLEYDAVQTGLSVPAFRSRYLPPSSECYKYFSIFHSSRKLHRVDLHRDTDVS
jgi:hypothetical protein